MPGISLKDAEQARLEITRSQAIEVEQLYRSVYRDMRKQLKSMTSGGATSSLRKSQLRQLTESLKAAYNTLGPQLESSITSSITDVSQAVVQANNSWMASAGLSVKGAYAYVPQDIVTLLASGKLYSDGWTLSKAIWGDSQKKAHEIDLIVAKGVAANKSAYDIAKDLEKYVNPGALKPWDWSKVYPGSSRKIDYNAQRLARTMVSHAYQQSLERVCSKNPFVDGYRWIDAHTDRTCQLCIDRATVDHYGMGPGVYPKGELPLDHPNGMCTFETHMTGDLNSISDRLADWVEGKEDKQLDEWGKNSGVKIPKGAPMSSMAANIVMSGSGNVNQSVWEKSLTSEEREALSINTGRDNQGIQMFLRGDISNIDQKYKDVISRVTSALDRARTSEDTSVSRGVDLYGFKSLFGIDGDYQSIVSQIQKDPKSFIGMEGKDKGFTSTTLEGGRHFDGVVEYKIAVPKGSHAAHVTPFSDNPQGKEKELLIQRDARYKISGVSLEEDKMGFTKIVVELNLEGTR